MFGQKRVARTPGQFSCKNTPVCGVSKTKQSFAKDCDVNVIIKKYKKTGQLKPGAPLRKYYYGDFSKMEGLQESFDKIERAQKGFMALSAQIRSKFNNDPIEFLKWISDMKNIDEARELGLLKRPLKVPKDPEKPLSEENPLVEKDNVKDTTPEA